MFGSGGCKSSGIGIKKGPKTPPPPPPPPIGRFLK